jgi:coenzyme F420-reducing hydrogenase delta subunit
VLRQPQDRRLVSEELEHTLRAAAESKLKPFIVGFCCQYGLFGTGKLSGLWRSAEAGIWMVPVLCTARVEGVHLLRAFEMGADGVFIAGCGEQCARENTALWVSQRVARVKKTLEQIGLEPERLHNFSAEKTEADLAAELDEFREKISGLYLAQVLMQEVKS